MSSIANFSDGLFAYATTSPVACSLYDLSPATVQSLISSWVGQITRSQQNTSASSWPTVIWVKPPRKYLWQAELQPLAQVENLSLYLFANKQDEIYVDDLEEVDELKGRSSSSDLPLPKTLISLPCNSPLAKDYFFLIWSPSCQASFVAQSTTANNQVELDLDNLSGESEDETYDMTLEDHNQPLNLIFSFESAFTQQLTEGIAKALASEAKLNPEHDHISQWQQQTASTPVAKMDGRAFTHLYAAQIQKQEDLWQQTQQLQAPISVEEQELTPMLVFEEAFLSHLGQELRTPLASIKTALSLLNSPALKPPQREKYMDLIARECDRQNNLITNLMNLVELNQELKDSRELQPIQLKDIIPTVVSTYQPLATEKGIRLAYTLSDQLPYVIGQPHWLQQMIIHLLNNGIQFTPRGGQVWIRARPEGDLVHIEVKDSGLGIPAGEIPKIFNYFYRTRQADKESIGVGMGLTIVQQLVTHCGGSISVKSRVGEGSTFHILLPIHSCD